MLRCVRWLACAGLLLLASRTRAQEEKSTDQDYFPFDEGMKMKWTYLTDEGKEVVKSLGRKLKDHDGNEYRLVENFSLGFDQGGDLCVSAKGVEFGDGIGTKSAWGGPWLKFPLVTNDTWDVMHWSGRKMFSVHVVGEETIETISGKFKTLRVETTLVEEKGLLVTWYAKGIGEVKSEYTYKKDGQSITKHRELKRFEKVVFGK